MKQQLLERLTRYVKIDTQADYYSTTTPSSEGQWELAKLLQQELTEMGLVDIDLDDNCYLFATLPSNSDKKVPTIGLLAHIDTATDFTGKNVNPQVHENYDGQDIVLNAAQNIVMKVSEFPNLKNYIGHTLVTTDGTTLLGADDKAGMAEIMTALDYLIKHPEIKHGDIRVAFTPDEEIGRGPHKFDVAKFNADFAYTMDGSVLGELEYETFNAARLLITFNGSSVHPGTAKNKMVNALKLAFKFDGLLPQAQAPEYTEGYEGFFHLTDLSGDVEQAKASYIIRDHDRQKFEAKKALVEQAITFIQSQYGEASIIYDLHDEYYNMREKIEPVIDIVNVVRDVMHELNIEPKIGAIRGGTDGAQLSFKGLPTPNIFTGGENYHGKFEFASLEVMAQATQVIINALAKFEEKA